MIPRKRPRMRVRFPVTFTGDREGKGRVADLSLCGCRVEGANAVVSRALLLTMRLQSSDDIPITVDAAVVRWTSQHDFGCEFIFVDLEHRRRLERYLSRLPSDPSAPSVDER